MPTPTLNAYPLFLLTVPTPAGMGVAWRNGGGASRVGAAEVIGNTDGGTRACVRPKARARAPAGEHDGGVDCSGRRRGSFFF